MSVTPGDSGRIDGVGVHEYAENGFQERENEEPMPEESSGQVTQLLQHWVRGDEKALHDLTPVVYQELRRLARSHLRSERANHTLQSTALVNEAFVRLLGAQPLDLHSRVLPSIGTGPRRVSGCINK